MSKEIPVGSAFWERKLSRRRLLKNAVLGGAGLATAAVFGCGEETRSVQQTTTPISPTPYETMPVTPPPVDRNKLYIADSVDWIKYVMIPEDVRVPHWTNEELEAMQRKVEKAVANGDLQRSAEIFRGLRENYGGRWYIPMSIVRNPAVFANRGDDDSDGDGISDCESVRNGINPYNPMETDPNKPSERWLILANGSNEGTNYMPNAHNVLYQYHTAKRNGYDDDHIIVFLQTFLEEQDPEKIIKPNLWKGKYGGMNLIEEPAPVIIDYKDRRNVTNSNLLNAIRNLHSDDNDLVTIIYNGHGDTNILYINPQNRLTASSFNNAMQNLHGTLVLMLGSSYAGGFVAKLAPHETAILVTGNRADESEMVSAAWGTAVASNLDNGLPIKLAGRGVAGRGGDGIGGSEGDGYNLLYFEDGKQIGFYSAKKPEFGGGEFGDLGVSDWTNPFIYLPRPEK